MVDAMFIFILFFLSRLTFVQFGFHSVVSSYAWFILFYCVTSLGSTLFSIMFIPHCKYFFLSSCTRNMAHSHNAVNTRSQSLLHRKYTCTRGQPTIYFAIGDHVNVSWCRWQTKSSVVMATSHVVASHITKLLSSFRPILEFRFRENQQERIPP